MAAMISVINLIDPNYSPSSNQFQKWIDTTLCNFTHLKHLNKTKVEIVIADIATSANLNLKYRKNPSPTNVLSFNYDSMPGEKEPFLGEIILCAEVITNEAREQNKPILFHYAHLTVHATLHLLGYDHRTEEEANTMQAHEIQILTGLGYSNPYQS